MPARERRRNARLESALKCEDLFPLTNGRFPLTADSQLQPIPMQARSHLRLIPTNSRFSLSDSHLERFPLRARSRQRPPIPTYGAARIPAKDGSNPTHVSLFPLSYAPMYVLAESAAVETSASADGDAEVRMQHIAA